MTFSINGIKQEKKEKYTVEILVCVDAPLLARKILEHTNILILSLKEFSTENTRFGDVYFTIKLNFQDIDIVTKYEDIQQACDFFTLLWFDIYKINSYAHPISDQKSATIIAKSKNIALSKKILIQDQIQKEEEENKKVYEDVHLQSAKKIIVHVFEKIETTVKRSEQYIEIQDMKKLKTLAEDLKKLRMGTNFEKISESIQEIFKILEKINTEYYLRIETTNDTIFPKSCVTSLDVIKETERMENIKILKSLGAKISLKNQDYVILGSSAIFWKFLQKDFISKCSDIWWLLYTVYDIVEFLLIWIIIMLAIYIYINELYMFSPNHYGLVFSLITIGVRGIIVCIARYFRNKMIGRDIIIVWIWIVLHYILMRIITTNLAL